MRDKKRNQNSANASSPFTFNWCQDLHNSHNHTQKYKKKICFWGQDNFEPKQIAIILLTESKSNLTAIGSSFVVAYNFFLPF